MTGWSPRELARPRGRPPNGIETFELYHLVTGKPSLKTGKWRKLLQTSQIKIKLEA